MLLLAQTECLRYHQTQLLIAVKREMSRASLFCYRPLRLNKSPRFFQHTSTWLQNNLYGEEGPSILEVLPLCHRPKRSTRVRNTEEGKDNQIFLPGTFLDHWEETSCSLCEEGFLSYLTVSWNQSSCNIKQGQCSPSKGEVAAQPQWLFPSLRFTLSEERLLKR